MAFINLVPYKQRFFIRSYFPASTFQVFSEQKWKIMSVVHFCGSFISTPSLACFHVCNKKFDPYWIYGHYIFQIDLPRDWILQWNLVRLLYTIAARHLKLDGRNRRCYERMCWLDKKWVLPCFIFCEPISHFKSLQVFKAFALDISNVLRLESSVSTFKLLVKEFLMYDYIKGSRQRFRNVLERNQETRFSCLNFEKDDR